MDHLDDVGDKIYSDYITHKHNWVKYIKEKSIKKMNDYLSKRKILFNKCEYYNYTLSDIQSKKIIIDKDMKSKYNKLSILFHPDKFSIARSDEFFALINVFYTETNIIIDIIDVISQYILELDNLDNIITNLNLIYKTKINVNNIFAKDLQAHIIFEKLNAKILDTTAQVKCDGDDTEDDNFLESTLYGFYMDKKSSIDYLNEIMLTEEQLIDEINHTSEYEQDFISYCIDKYPDNVNVKSACVIWLTNIKEKLKKKKSELIEQLNKTS